MSLKSVPYVILSMTLLNVSATLGIVTTRIGSKADVSAGCPCCGVDCISERQWGTEFCLHYGYHSRTSLMIPGMWFCARLVNSPDVFPHKIDSGNPFTTFSVNNFHIIAATTEVKVLPRPISSTTSTPGISESQTHLLTKNHMAETWCARNFVPGRPPLEFLWHGTRSSVDWQIWWAFSSLTASSRHWCSNWLSIVLRTVFNTELGLSGWRSSSPSTCSWTSLAPWMVFFLSSMISFSCSEVCCADGLILWHSWYSSRCQVFHRQAFGPNQYVEYNQFYSLNQNLHYYYCQSLSHLPAPPILFHFHRKPTKSKYND